MTQLVPTPIWGKSGGGDRVVSANTTDSFVGAGFTGSSGSKSLTTAASLALNEDDLLLTHYSRGAGSGNWGWNRVANYSGTTLTVQRNLSYSYTDSGDNQSQFIVVPEYRSMIVNGGVNLSVPSWNESTGGIAAYVCSGKITIAGNILGTGLGFKGGIGDKSSGAWGEVGEGTDGTQVDQQENNGTGGGGGRNGGNEGGDGAGGGGGHASAGEAGGSGGPADGHAGLSGGSADMLGMILGGAGAAGGGGSSRAGRNGGRSGSIIVLVANELEVTGSIANNGNNGVAGSVITPNLHFALPGGGGSGGSIYVVANKATIGSNLVTATKGSGGAAAGSGSSTTGGDGSDGRIRFDICSLSGSTSSPSSSNDEGGHSWCGSLSAIM